MSEPITPNELRRLFPGASQSTIRKNQASVGIPNSEQRERETNMGSGNAGEAQGSRCVPVCFTLYRVRPLDVDAKYSSVKDLLDCVVDAGFALGDKEDEIDLEVRQVKVRSYNDERTEIEIGE